MSYPTPMDIAESEDREADLSPSERLANIVEALEEDLDESPFTREEWNRLDAERLELLAANDALAAEVESYKREIQTWYDKLQAADAEIKRLRLVILNELTRESQELGLYNNEETKNV